MARYLDPKNDLIFKRIFGGHKHICMSLLNNMLPLEPSQQIVSLEYQPPELVPEIPLLKNSIVDVRCTDNRGRQFIVEMQMHWVDSFRNRMLFNASKAYVMQLEKAKTYEFLQPVYALGFINDTFDSNPVEYYHHYKIVNIADTDKCIEGLEFVFIELPKFFPSNRAEKKLYDLWLLFLTRLDEVDEVPPALLEEDITREAVQYLEIGSYSRAELEAYDRYWDAIRTERTLIFGSEARGEARGRAEGRAQGETIGLEKGRAEGRAEGLAEGRAEGVHKLICKMHQAGLPLPTISAISELPEEEVRRIIHNSGRRTQE